MKLKFFDKILVALLLAVAVIVAFGLFAMATGILSGGVLGPLADAASADVGNALITAGIGAVLLAIVVRLIFAGREKKPEQKVNTALIAAGENGSAFIALSAIDMMVQKHCRQSTWCRDCHTNIRTLEEGGIAIAIRLSVQEDTNVAAVTEELKNSLRAYIEELTGVCVKGIDMLIDRVEPAALPAAETKA